MYAVIKLLSEFFGCSVCVSTAACTTLLERCKDSHSRLGTMSPTGWKLLTDSSSLTSVLQWFLTVLWVKSEASGHVSGLRHLLWPRPSPSLLSSHWGSLDIPQTGQAHSCLRAFALAMPSAWNILLPGYGMAHTLPSFQSLLRGPFQGGLLCSPRVPL